MIDTHCHIHFRAFKDDMDEAIARSLEVGVRMMTIGTQSDTSRHAVEVAEAHEGVWCAVGVHPSHTHAHTLHVDESETIQTREETFDAEFYGALARSSQKVVAIGEVGLDAYRLPKDEGEAMAVLAAQEHCVRSALNLADEVGLPVVLHVRDAHARMLAILTAYLAEGKLARRGVVHCFTGTVEEARAYHAMGFLTSITGIVTFADKRDPAAMTDLQKTVAALPLEMLMVETDAPYLAPAAHRGKRCEPWMVREVAAKIAQLQDVSVEEVERVTDANAQKLFGISW